MTLIVGVAGGFEVGVIQSSDQAAVSSGKEAVGAVAPAFSLAAAILAFRASLPRERAS